MANEKHLLLTAQGDYTDPNLIEESWQVGIRLALVFGNVDSVGVLPNNWDPAAVTINRTETHWGIVGNWIAPGPSGTFHPDDYLNDHAAPAFATWLNAFPALSDACRLRSLKLSPIGTDGRAVPAPPYTQGSPCTLTWTSSYPLGSNSSIQLPLQNSLVMSHRTPQIGRRGRGRMFVAGLTAALIDAHAHVASGVVTSALSAQVALMHSLTYAGSTLVDPHVKPIVVGHPWTNYGVITSVRCGNVSDTQRRRRRSLTETVTSSSV
jgi:predicted nucleic acid-binding Zn ribbon protein